ncbi:MAG: RNA polymerase sigma-70 factor [Balneolaceae bacterium]|nr:RNA polymerase sigma-70 factor [Balneolaceae bacterium]MCH8548023.1 RNA polymerase sigma-70 factor [Balneolaceae bacterium]
MSEKDREHIETLVELISESDRKAFDRLFRLFYEPMVRYAIRFTKEKAAACDVAQESFIALWQNRKRIDPEQPLKAYLYRIVRNRAINWIQRLDNRNEPLENAGPVSEDPKIHEEENQDDFSAPFEIWIRELPDRQQEAFELSRFDGLSHEEIASVMDLSPKTVNNHIVSALRTLREKYEQHLSNYNEG